MVRLRKFRYFLFFLCLTAAVWPESDLFTEEGLASWYGGKFQGRKTANGEIFDTYKLTAAHKTLPFNTLVTVTNLDTVQSVVVRINDRGPFVEGRIIDLSKAAADAIGMTARGVARVRIVAGKSTETAPSAELYTIQIGAFSDPANAERVKARLEAAGLTVAVIPNAAGIIRVCVVGISLSDLETTRQKLHTLGFGDYIVRKE